MTYDPASLVADALADVVARAVKAGHSSIPTTELPALIVDHLHRRGVVIVRAPDSTESERTITHG